MSLRRAALGVALLLGLLGLGLAGPARAQPSSDFRAMLAGHTPDRMLMTLGPAAVEPLVAELGKGRFYPYTFEALAATRHPRARATLLERLRDPGTLDTEQASRMRAAAIRGLTRFSPDEEITRAIADALTQAAARRDRWTEEAAREALLLLARPESLPALLAYSQGRPDGQDDPGLRALVRIGGPEAMARVRELLRTDKEYMGWFGKLVLECALQGRREALPELVAVAERALKRGSIDDDAIRAFGLMRDPRLQRVLLEMVEKRDFRDQYWAAVALAEYGDRAMLPVLRQAFAGVKAYPASPAYENKAALAFALARLGAPEGARYLEELSREAELRPSIYGHLFLVRLRGQAAARAALDRIAPYRDAEHGYQGVPTDQLAEALLALGDPPTDVRLVEALAWKGAANFGYALRRALSDAPAGRLSAALLAGLRSPELGVVNHAFTLLLEQREDPSPILARALAEGSLPARVLAARYLGLFARERYHRQLEAAGRDPDWQVAMEAAWILERTDQGGSFPSREPSLAALPNAWRWATSSVAGQGRFTGYVHQANFSDPMALRAVRRLVRLADGRVAVAGEGGLHLYDGMQWRTLGRAAGLCGDDAADLLVQGDRWLVGSPHGLSIGDGRKFRCVPPGSTPAPMRLAAGGGQVFAGTSAGVFALEGERLKPLGGPDLPVHALAVAADGALWVATVQAESRLDPPLHRLQRGSWTSFGEPFQHFNKAAVGLGESLVPSPVKVFDLQLDRQGRPLLATSYGVLAWDGKRFENLSLRGGARPWFAVHAAREDRAGRVWALWASGQLAALEAGRWRVLDLVDAQRRNEILLTARLGGELLEDGDGLWIALPSPLGLDMFARLFEEAGDAAPSLGMSVSLLRRLDTDPARTRLPPDTLIASVSAGAFSLANPDVDMSPPDRARRFLGGETQRIPANVVTLSAVAKDPWDYGPVQYQYKLDEDEWTAWSDRNVLITPNILDEGVHRVQVRARDREGHVDPTPAELRFTVFTKELTILKIQDGQFERVFPAQYLRYQKDGLGKVLLQNLQDQPVQVDLELKVEDLFEKPAGTSLTLGPHEKKWVQVAAPFSEAVLQNPSQRVAQAVVEARFVYEGVDRSTRRAFGVQLMEANAFAWDEPARLASFIHGGDPAVGRLAAEVHRQLSAAHPGEARQAHPLRNYLAALYAYEALRGLGVSYKPDPARPFRGLKAGAVDSVLFPGQTLLQRGGDCDDLVVLYCALLENLNVPTALVPVPGHIYMLLDTGVRVENRAAFPGDARQTIARDGRLWLPVEVTSLGQAKPFAAAWAAGAEAHVGKYRPRPGSLVEVRAAWAENPPALLAQPAGPAEAPALDLAAAAAQAGEVLGGQRVRAEKLAPAGEGRAALLGRGQALL
ncbi:MAG TPA: hypothetical protein P5076_13865, partial [Myxococcota bacterium]|nr:hypothetical protein [Myxococcota bacterium]